MNADRTETINGNKIEEFYWAGRFVVYVNNSKIEATFDEEVKRQSENREFSHEAERNCE